MRQARKDQDKRSHRLHITLGTASTVQGSDRGLSGGLAVAHWKKHYLGGSRERRIGNSKASSASQHKKRCFANRDDYGVLSTRFTIMLQYEEAEGHYGRIAGQLEQLPPSRLLGWSGMARKAQTQFSSFVHSSLPAQLPCYWSDGGGIEIRRS